MKILSKGSFFFLIMLLMFFSTTMVMAQEGGAAVGEEEAGKETNVAEDGVKGDDAFRKGLEEGGKRLVEEEYWKERQEQYRKKLRKKREEALRKAQERETQAIWEALELFLYGWSSGAPPRPARPPIIMDYKEAFDNLPRVPEPEPESDKYDDFVDLPEVKTWTQEEVDQYWQDREEELEEIPDAIGPVTGPFAVAALVKNGLVGMEITGAGTTTDLVFNLTNKTDEPILAVIPAGTPLVTDSEGYQPYQTGIIAPFFLEPGQTLTRECPAWCTDNDLEPAPADGSAKYTLQTSSFTPQQEKVKELILLADYMEDLHIFCGDVVEPDDFVQSPQPPATTSVEQKASKNIPQSTSLSFDLSSPLEFPGTMQFSLSAEDSILKHSISSKDDKNEEIVFTNPQGKVEVSVKLTDNPALLKFDITELSASADSFEVSGNSKGDINIVLDSPEKSTGFLNINTGEVNGTVCVNASGNKYKDPFPAAGTFTGMFDFPTRKLSMSFNGLSFEPVKLEKGLYQTSQPEKFWETVHLYTVWGETNNIGREELTELMTEQFSASYPEEKAGKLGNMVAGEIMDRVNEVQTLHEELKEEEYDFSMLDPTLKFRASQPKTDKTKGTGKGGGNTDKKDDKNKKGDKKAAKREKKTPIEQAEAKAEKLEKAAEKAEKTAKKSKEDAEDSKEAADEAEETAREKIDDANESTEEANEKRAEANSARERAKKTKIKTKEREDAEWEAEDAEAEAASAESHAKYNRDTAKFYKGEAKKKRKAAEAAARKATRDRKKAKDARKAADKARERAQDKSIKKAIEKRKKTEADRKETEQKTKKKTAEKK